MPNRRVTDAYRDPLSRRYDNSSTSFAPAAHPCLYWMLVSLVVICASFLWLAGRQDTLHLAWLLLPAGLLALAGMAFVHRLTASYRDIYQQLVQLKDAAHLNQLTLQNKQIEKAVLAQALNDSELRTRDIIRLNRDYIWETDTQFNYTYISPQVEAVRHIPRTELLETSLFMGVSTSCQEQITEALRSSLKQREAVRCQLTRQRPNGDPLVEHIHAIALIDSAGCWLGFRGVAYPDHTEKTL